MSDRFRSAELFPLSVNIQQKMSLIMSGKEVLKRLFVENSIFCMRKRRGCVPRLDPTCTPLDLLLHTLRICPCSPIGSTPNHLKSI